MNRDENDKINGIVTEQIDSVMRSFIAGDIGEPALVKYLMSWEKYILASSFVASVKLYVVKELMRFGHEGGLEKFQDLMAKYPDSRSVMEVDGLINRRLNGLIDRDEFIAQIEHVQPRILGCMIDALLDIMGGFLCEVGNTPKEK